MTKEWQTATVPALLYKCAGGNCEAGSQEAAQLRWWRGGGRYSEEPGWYCMECTGAPNPLDTSSPTLKQEVDRRDSDSGMTCGMDGCFNVRDGNSMTVCILFPGSEATEREVMLCVDCGAGLWAKLAAGYGLAE